MSSNLLTPRSPTLEALRVNILVGRARTKQSQEELATRAGIGRATVSRLERGVASDVGLATLEAIADALGITVSALFVPASVEHVGEAELDRRESADDDEFIEAGSVLAAIDEAAGEIDRYSNAGRPRLSR